LILFKQRLLLKSNTKKMNFEKIFNYIIRPIFVMFVASFVVDIPFGREQDLTTRITRAIVIGLVLGLIWWVSDNYRKKQKGD